MSYEQITIDPRALYLPKHTLDTLHICVKVGDIFNPHGGTGNQVQLSNNEGVSKIHFTEDHNLSILMY